MTNMRITECKIVLPVSTGDGRPASPHIAAAEQSLKHFFGGFTVTPGTGAYVSDLDECVEKVRVYSVAADWSNPELVERMRSIATRYACDAAQHSVYLCLNEEVLFIPRQLH